MEKQFVMNNIKLRYLLQYYYDKGKNAAQACDKICAVNGNGTLCRDLLLGNGSLDLGDFDVRDESRSGRPVADKPDEILNRIRRNKYLSSAVIGADLGIDHKTVLSHLHRAGFKKKRDAWVRHTSNLENNAKKESIKPEEKERRK